MAFFYVKLVPPTSTFAIDMSEEERVIMVEHRTHMDRWFAEGKVLLFGPVLDPTAIYGVAVMECDTIEEVESIFHEDPSVKSGLNRVEIYPMRIGAAQAPRKQEA